MEAVLGLIVLLRAPSRAGSLPQWLAVDREPVDDADPVWERACPRRRPQNYHKNPTITCVDIHHRRECLPLKNRQRRINLNPPRNLEPEGKIMLIHLLTCLALTALTLSVLSWYVLTEECTS